ncbi:MAG TPA: mechanosensitive ion channel [Ignavibacteria bacterium]|mgnify:CR=1 FL=1|nr:mechanosensitive ion channel [Ignavibacteria bacterium]HMQ98424.1 mechanosensitive ion channel [Ignavibacteria bacterium]
MLDKHSIEVLTEKIIEYLPKLALALITLVIGLYLIKLFIKFLGKVMESRKVDESLRPFFKTIASIILKVLLLISVMGMIGIEMTSFIALLGAVGISLGMALSGSLQHFAGGVLLLIYKPFSKGDFIEAQGHKGTVRELRIFNTVINTLENKVVFIPNGPLSTGTIVNYTLEPTRRIDTVFSISYTDDIKKAINIIQKVTDSNPKILKDPEVVIGVKQLSASSVDIESRVWVNTVDLVELGFFMNEAVKNEFDKNGITIPFPQMDVNLKKTD